MLPGNLLLAAQDTSGAGQGPSLSFSSNLNYQSRGSGSGRPRLFIFAAQTSRFRKFAISARLALLLHVGKSERHFCVRAHAMPIEPRTFPRGARPKRCPLAEVHPVPLPTLHPSPPPGLGDVHHNHQAAGEGPCARRRLNLTLQISGVESIYIANQCTSAKTATIRPKENTI